MLAWSEGTDNGRQKTRNHGCERHYQAELLLITPMPSQTCHAKPDSNQQAPDATNFFSVGGMPASSLAWKTSLRKGQDAVALPWSGAWRFTYDWWSLVISVRQSTVTSNIWATAVGAGYGQFEHKADSLIAKFKEAGGTVRDWCQAESPRLSRRLSIIVCLSWAVNHYRDNAESITYKAGATKMPENWSWQCHWLPDMQMRQRDVAALDAKIHEGVSWC